jgi:hypothetical protein
MSRLNLLLGVVVVAVLSVRPDALMAARQDFRVDNSTPWTIYYVNVRPSGGGYDWSEDVLGDDTLDAGETTMIHFNTVIGCIHDIRIEFNNNNWVSWENVNLCSISSFKIWYDFGQKSYEASWQ